MSRCKNCNLEILDETDRCPLCNSVLEYTVDVENMYPDVRVNSRRFMLFTRIYLFCDILVTAILVYINITSFSGAVWCIIPALIFLYGYLVLRYAVLGTSGYRSKMIVLVLIAILMLVAIDIMMGYGGWSLKYVVPSAVIAVDITIIIFMIANKRVWQSYIMGQIIMIICSIVPVFLRVIGLIQEINLVTKISIAMSVFLFVGTVIIGDRRAKLELKRRFHVR
jgi:hypothetical protein